MNNGRDMSKQPIAGQSSGNTKSKYVSEVFAGAIEAPRDKYDFTTLQKYKPKEVPYEWQSSYIDDFNQRK